MRIYRREKYLKRMRGFYHDDGMIKVITGVRRCGKSCLMQSIADELVESGVASDHMPLQLRHHIPWGGEIDLAGRRQHAARHLFSRHHGRYFILDWKSNRLGGRSANFLPERLPAAMVKRDQPSHATSAPKRRNSLSVIST